MIYSIVTHGVMLFARAESAIEARAIFARSLRAQAPAEKKNSIRVSLAHVREYCANYENRVSAPGLSKAIRMLSLPGFDDFDTGQSYAKPDTDFRFDAKAIESGVSKVSGLFD